MYVYTNFFYEAAIRNANAAAKSRKRTQTSNGAQKRTLSARAGFDKTGAIVARPDVRRIGSKCGQSDDNVARPRDSHCGAIRIIGLKGARST